MLFLVYGGELVHPQQLTFRDPANVEFVGVFDDHLAARQAWAGRAQSTVDNAHMRFIIDAVKPDDEEKVEALHEDGKTADLQKVASSYASRLKAPPV